MKSILFVLTIFCSTLLYGQVTNAKVSVENKLQKKFLYKNPIRRILFAGCGTREASTYYLLPDQILLPDRTKVCLTQSAEKNAILPNISALMQNPASCKITIIPYNNVKSFIALRK
jgi:hypothetical protein